MDSNERYVLPIEFVAVDVRTALGFTKGKPNLTEMANRYAVKGYQPTGLITIPNKPLSVVVMQFTHFGMCQEVAERELGDEGDEGEPVDDDDDEEPSGELSNPEIIDPNP